MRTAVHALAADVPGVIDAFTDAFADDPVQGWLFEVADDPDAGRRELMRINVEDYFWLGHLLVLRDGGGAVAGAAAWAPPDRNPIQGERVTDLLEALSPHLGPHLIPRLRELARAAEHRPPQPHFYLGILGVQPDQRGLGLGTDLLAPTLAECDRTGTLAHLESSNPRNLTIYERHGFHVVTDYRCGETGPVMTIMSRPPG